MPKEPVYEEYNSPYKDDLDDKEHEKELRRLKRDEEAEIIQYRRERRLRKKKEEDRKLARQDYEREHPVRSGLSKAPSNVSRNLSRFMSIAGRDTARSISKSKRSLRRESRRLRPPSGFSLRSQAGPAQVTGPSMLTQMIQQDNERNGLLVQRDFYGNQTKDLVSSSSSQDLFGSTQTKDLLGSKNKKQRLI